MLPRTRQRGGIKWQQDVSDTQWASSPFHVCPLRSLICEHVTSTQKNSAPASCIPAAGARTPPCPHGYPGCPGPAPQICPRVAWPRPEAPTVRKPQEASQPQRLRVVSLAAILQQAIFPERPVNTARMSLHIWRGSGGALVLSYCSAKVFSGSKNPRAKPLPSPQSTKKQAEVQKGGSPGPRQPCCGASSAHPPPSFPD